MAKSKIFRMFKEILFLNRLPFVDSLSLTDL